MVAVKIVIILFIILFGVGIIREITLKIRSLKFKETEATLVDKVVEYSDDYFKYYPEYKKVKENLDSIIESIDNIKTIRKNITGENENVEEDEVEREEKEWVLIYSYTVNGKGYYHNEGCINNFNIKHHLNEKKSIWYDPKNPTMTVSYKKISISLIIICLVMQAILLGFLYIINK